MVEIRCTGVIGTNNTDPNIFEIDPSKLVKFPNGELDYSIYRSPDGGDPDITFEGYDPQSAELGAFDTVLDDVLDITAVDQVLAPTQIDAAIQSVVFTSLDTDLSTLAQTAYNTPTFHKCVRTQFEKQFCPSGSTNLEQINVNILRNFLISVALPVSHTNITVAYTTVVRDELLTNPDGLIDIINATAQQEGFLFYFVKNLTQDEIVAKFHAEIITKSTRESILRCVAYERLRVIPKGLYLKLDLAGCTQTGEEIQTDIVPEGTQNANLYDALSLDNQFFSVANYGELDSTERSRNVVFRHQALDTAYFLNDGLGTLPFTRPANDVRKFDYALDSFNVDVDSLAT